MKLRLLLAAFIFGSLAPLPAAPPALPIEQALKLAQDHLASRGLTGQHYVVSLTMESSALAGGKLYWFARWEPSIPVDKKTESGLRVDMDGKLTRLTSGGRARTPTRSGFGAQAAH